LPDWRDDAATAVEAWIAAEGRGNRRPERTTLGTARPEGDGWYAVDLRRRQPNPDALDGLQLVSPDGQRLYHAMQVVQEGEILRIRVSRHVKEGDLHVTAIRKPAAMLLDSLRDRLRAMVDPGGLAQRLAIARPDRLPGTTSEPPPAGFTPGQAQAFHACLVPGLRLVWGPPGTGKTLVLAKAIDRLLQRGRRVLLVSGTNVAVDNALSGVTNARPWGPGTLVRVGHPQVREVADDESVSLARLTAARAAELELERKQVEDRLVELTTPSARRRELDDALATFDPDAYAAAARLVEVDERIRALAERLQALTAAAATASAVCAAAELDRREAEREWAAMEPARTHLEQAATLRTEIDELSIRANRARARHAEMIDRQESMRAHLAAAESARGIAWLRNRTEAKRLREQASQLDGPVDRARQAAESAEQLAADQQRLLAPRIAADERAAAPLDDARVEAHRSALEAARRLAMETAARAGEAEGRAEAVRAELLAAESGPRASDEQRRLVAAADAAGWPALHAEREQLRLRDKLHEQELQRLERRHEELLRQEDRLARDAEREIIGQARLVATTLAQFRLHPAVHAGLYDTVLVDEVGAATLIEVLVAVAAARLTAVLLGDFLQLGPVLDKVENSPSPQVRRWVTSTCFDQCGIQTPAQAQANEACAVLEKQYRFGPDVMDLANLAMYAGTLQAGRDLARSESDPEIVLIDTDGLGEMGRARPGPGGKSRWWPAGSLLAPILARHHTRGGERVGLIAPYRPQADAMLEALHDTEGDRTRLTTEVGTVHGFQGREFDVVVFDLVEDGDWTGWIAGSRLAPDASGARVLNVGITRGKTRLYLIGSGRLIRSASAGPRMALTPVRELLEAGRVHVVKATTLLQVPGDDAPPALDPVVDELAEALASHVRVVGIHDERTYFAELRRYLEEAKESVWLWAPWTTLRTEELLPALRAARDRGVRVTVFARTDDDHLMRGELAQRELARLRDAVTLVVQAHGMHQKVVVVDTRTVMYGSLNTLSHRNTREIMVIHEGAHFARKLLDHEYAEAFADPQRCACGDQAAVWRSGHGWFWRCAKRTCNWTEEVRLTSRPAGRGTT
jgi:AAA domain/PLD-like domain